MSMISEHLGDEFDYRLDMECPDCDQNCGVSEATDGEEYECKNCGVDLQAIGYDDGIMRFHLAEVTDSD